ncbi:MAG TPA: urease accessory protein UreD [Propionibacteriaceae bacterium]
MTETRVCLEAGRVWLRHGQLRAQQGADRKGWTRIALLATTALLLGGDEVELRVEVGAGQRLDLYDVAGTVAYHGRGDSSAWRLSVEVQAGGALRYRGEPFVVSDGADVTRTTDLALDPDASLWLRETVVLGRHGQIGGRLRTHTRLRVGGHDAWREDQDLDPTRTRCLPGLLGNHRVLDSVVAVGAAEPPPAHPRMVRFGLVGGAGSVTRHLGTDLADSPLHQRE